ncbi:MAG: hypothetical protein AAFX10_03405 [Pseudomonadota bacterium]
MIFTLLGTIVLGVAVAGALLFVVRVLKVPLPRWVIPTAAGAAMLIFHVYIAYTWIDRTVAALPASIRVVQVLSERSLLQPWSLVRPVDNRFTAIDVDGLKHNAAHPGLVLTQVLFVQRYYPTVVVDQLYDCNNSRRADLAAEDEIGPDGLPRDLQWIDLAPDDAARQVVCSA